MRLYLSLIAILLFLLHSQSTAIAQDNYGSSMDFIYEDDAPEAFETSETDENQFPLGTNDTIVTFDADALLDEPEIIIDTSMVDMPIVKLRSLDKTTARTMTFDARVGNTVKFGPLYIKVRACRKAPPIATPESAAFLQIWEIDHANEAKWIFSGWMFASSPGLSAMDHAIYDVWVLDCKMNIDDVETAVDQAGEAPEDNNDAEAEAEAELSVDEPGEENETADSPSPETP